MAVTIDPIDKITNPRPTISGSTSEPQALLNFNGENYLVNASGGRWSVNVSEAGKLVNDGTYRAGVISGAFSAQHDIRFAAPLTEARDVPTYEIPETTPPVTVLAGATDVAVVDFTGLTSDTSTSCDLFGTVQGLASELTRTVYDSLGNVIGTIKESTATLTASIKNALGDIFGGSGGFLNTVKEYVTSAYTWASDVASKMTESATEAVAWAREKVAAGQQYVYDQIVALREQMFGVEGEVNSFIGTLQSKFTGLIDGIRDGVAVIQGLMASARAQIGRVMGIVGDAVRGLALASCNTINSVLAGTPDNAFANLTNGATTPALKALGATKDIFNTGAGSMAEVNAKIVDSTGIGDIFDSVRNTSATIATNVTSTNDTVTSGTDTKRVDLYASFDQKPVMPA